MKKFPLFDVLFVICSVVILLLIDHFVDPFISKYSILLVLFGYYIGKHKGKAEMEKNKAKE